MKFTVLSKIIFSQHEKNLPLEHIWRCTFRLQGKNLPAYKISQKSALDWIFVLHVLSIPAYLSCL